jgi:hypothetical protein
MNTKCWCENVKETDLFEDSISWEDNIIVYAIDLG